MGNVLLWIAVGQWTRIVPFGVEFSVVRFLPAAGVCSACGFSRQPRKGTCVLMNACSRPAEGVLFIGELKLKLQKLYFERRFDAYVALRRRIG